ARSRIETAISARQRWEAQMYVRPRLSPVTHNSSIVALTTPALKQSYLRKPQRLSGSSARSISSLTTLSAALQRSLPPAQLGEQDHFPDLRLPRQHHHQPVDAHPEPARWWHPMLQRHQEVLVQRLDVLESCRLKSHLRLEALSLVDRVVELRVRIAQLEPRDEHFEPLDDVRLTGLRLRERRDLRRIVEQKCR